MQNAGIRHCWLSLLDRTKQENNEELQNKKNIKKLEYAMNREKLHKWVETL